MEKEQEINLNRMQEIAAPISEEEHSEGDVRTFMEEIKSYDAITELDEAVLNRLINRILIGKPEKVDDVKTQEVRIVYNFVGELWNNRTFCYVSENDNHESRDSMESLLYF